MFALTENGITLNSKCLINFEFEFASELIVHSAERISKRPFGGVCSDGIVWTEFAQFMPPLGEEIQSEH